MKREIAILDTSLYCCWLGVSGKETAGSGADIWNSERVNADIERLVARGATIVLPLATILETGNHISQAVNRRFEDATKLCEHIRAAIQGTSPWVTFSEQASFWTAEQLLTLIEEWPPLANARMSFGDATIKKIADYYAQAGFNVRILTADHHLRGYEATGPTIVPRRNR